MKFNFVMYTDDLILFACHCSSVYAATMHTEKKSFTEATEARRLEDSKFAAVVGVRW